MRELPMYQGAVRQGAQQQFVRVQAPRVELMGAAVDDAMKQLGAGAQAVIDLHDFGVQQDVEAKQRANDIVAEKEFMRRSSLPWGDDEGFYLKDGRVNEDSVRRFIGEQQQKNAAVEGDFWGAEGKLEYAARLNDVNGRLERRVMLGLAEQENANRRRAFEANYELAVERGDLPGALRVLDDAERAGQLLPAEVAKRKLQLQRKNLKDVGAAGGSVVVNGREYSGASAGLAVARAKEGYKPGQSTKDDVQSEQALTLDEDMMRAAAVAGEEGLPVTLQSSRMDGIDVPEQVPVEPVAIAGEGLSTLGPNGELPVRGQDGAAAQFMTLNEEQLAGVSAGDVAQVAKMNEFLEPGAEPEAMSEEERSWTLLPERDVREFFEAMDAAVHVKERLREDGGVDLFCVGYAPDVMQRVVARANAAGELTAADAGEMVTRIALDAVHADRGASVESLLKMFDGAGVYEALGEGDAEVGKVRAAAMVRDVHERMQHGTNKLGMAAIARMVQARVEEVYRASGRDVSRLNPHVDEDEKWNARKTDRRWHELKHIYLRLRKEYNPSLEDGLSHDEIMDEFDEHAQRFYDWYAKGVGGKANAEYKAALEDWYLGQLSMRLMDAYVDGGRYEDGADGYAADVAVARDVLKQAAPAEVNADVLVKMCEDRQKADSARAVELRKEAQVQYAKLHGLKEERSMVKQREEKAKKKADEKAAREEEKKRKAEEKKAQLLEERKLAMKRAQPRRAAWEWDGVQAADGEAAACSLPKAEWDALVEELGYDGSTNVYVQLGSRKVLVTGFHEGAGLRLNTPAAMLLQDSRAKAKGLRTSGELGYSYSFK